MSSYNDTLVPKVFTVITSHDVSYNMDFVNDLVEKQKIARVVSGQAPMSDWELSEYRRDLVRKLIIQGDAEGALALTPKTTRKQLNG